MVVAAVSQAGAAPGDHGGNEQCLLQASVRMAGRQGGAAVGASKVENQVATAGVCMHVVDGLALVLGRGRRRGCSWASVVEEAARAQGSRSVGLLLEHAGRLPALAPQAVGAVAHGTLSAFRKTLLPVLAHAHAPA
jgi:hypothetical protein